METLIFIAKDNIWGKKRMFSIQQKEGCDRLGIYVQFLRLCYTNIKGSGFTPPWLNKNAKTKRWEAMYISNKIWINKNTCGENLNFKYMEVKRGIVGIYKYLS